MYTIKCKPSLINVATPKMKSLVNLKNFNKHFFNSFHLLKFIKSMQIKATRGILKEIENTKG